MVLAQPTPHVRGDGVGGCCLAHQHPGVLAKSPKNPRTGNVRQCSGKSHVLLTWKVGLNDYFFRPRMGDQVLALTKTICPLIVRPVRQGDRENWTPLWVGYNEFYGRSGTTSLPEAVTNLTWERFLAPEEPVHALVVDRGGELLGLVHYLFHRTTTRIGPDCYLNDLFTSCEARGQGVGRALIDGVCDAARRQGCESVYWLTHETNLTARRLYDQLADNSGFVRYVKAT